MKPLVVCAHPGCPVLTEQGSCETHRREALPDQRPSASARGYGRKWTGYAKRYKAEHPWCRHCQQRGRKAPTEIVDHIVPVAGPRDPGFWQPSNHQPLCRPCHGVKTAKEGRTAQHAPPEDRTWWFV